MVMEVLDAPSVGYYVVTPTYVAISQSTCMHAHTHTHTHTHHRYAHIRTLILLFHSAYMTFH